MVLCEVEQYWHEPFIPPVYKVYRGYIVFAFSECLCVNFFLLKSSQELLCLGF